VVYASVSTWIGGSGSTKQRKATIKLFCGITCTGGGRGIEIRLYKGVGVCHNSFLIYSVVVGTGSPNLEVEGRERRETVCDGRGSRKITDLNRDAVAKSVGIAARA
jgi:hypothetical protein